MKVVKPIELKEFQILKRKICRIESDLWFLNKCKQKHLLPKYIECNIRGKLKSSSAKFAIEKAKQYWLRNELKLKYSLLSKIELRTYKLHRHLTNTMHSIDWDSTAKELYSTFDKYEKDLMYNKRRKLKHLVMNSSRRMRNSSKFIQNFLINKSDEILDNNEIKLLNKGLNFALPYKMPPLKQQIIDCELALNRVEPDKIEKLRGDIRNIMLQNENECSRKRITKNETSAMYEAVKSLNSKNIYVTKADKGNCVIVLNQIDYDNGMKKLIDEGNYRIVPNPLERMKSSIKVIVNNFSDLFGNYWKNKMLLKNAKVPRIYGLFKQHKPGNTFRPIVSNINSPTTNLSKWLCKRFVNLNQFDKFSVKNSLDLIDNLKDVELNENERLVSFDIKSYFSNVPKAGALDALHTWLDKQNINVLEREALFELTKGCINLSYFQFRNKFYEQLDGLAMGLSLSPFLCNLFMLTIEERCKNMFFFPSIYYRYVDDCFAVVEEDKIDDTLNNLNSICSEIQFTIEVEENRKLAFLDLEIQRTFTNKIEFDIFRKNTTTERFITVESNHHSAQIYSAFNSMIYRMINVPLSIDKYNIEQNKIYEIAEINGINPEIIEFLIKKHKRRKNFKDCTTFISDKTGNSVRCAMTFENNSFEKLSKVFKKENICLVPSTQTKLKSLLKSTKDKLVDIEKSGVYRAICSTNNCNAVYIGQTLRNVKVRAKEHLNYIKKKEDYKSGLSEHILTNKHTIKEDNFELLECESNKNRLDVLESLHIYLNRNNVNRDAGPHYTNLFMLLSNTHKN